MNAWYVIKTTAHREQAVALFLAEQNIATFCPMQLVASLVYGRKRQQTQALFQTYVFAYWDSSDARQWHVIMNTPGVVEILGGEIPTRVAPGIVESWIARANDYSVIEDLVTSLADLKRGYKLNDEVRISGGSLEVLTGTVAWIDDAKQYVGVKVSIFGRTIVIVRRTTDCELCAHAPLSSSGASSRRGYRRGGKRGHRARVKAVADHLSRNLPIL